MGVKQTQKTIDVDTTKPERQSGNAYLNYMCGKTSLGHLETKCCPILTGSYRQSQKECKMNTDRSKGVPQRLRAHHTAFQLSLRKSYDTRHISKWGESAQDLLRVDLQCSTMLRCRKSFIGWVFFPVLWTCRLQCKVGCLQAFTFQTEDPLAQSIHNVFQGSFVGHVEEMLVVRIAGDVFDLTEESLWVDPSTVIVAQHLEKIQIESK